MLKKHAVKVLSLFVVTVMFLGIFAVSGFAAGNVTNYADFLANFKVLETYAEAYPSKAGKTTGELVLNFVRTGVERYRDGNWITLAGAEITGFTEYVEQQDAKNGTTVMNLRDIIIDDFKLPNGNQADFGHMFGTMNISYLNKSNVKSADLAGWAGDLCDLLYYCVEQTSVPAGTVDQMADYILKNCFGVNADDAYGWDDFYGDMDGYYLVNEYFKGNGSFSELMEKYYVASLDDSDRAAYFLNNRVPGKTTQAEVRNAIYDTYRTNVAIQVLEADRGVTNYNELRKAACYAFADYLFSKAEGRLEGGSGNDGEDDKPANGFYTVFSSTDSILAPGITQQINYATSADGKQMVYYLANVDVNRDDVTIKANYKDNDPSKGWGMQRVQDQVEAMVKNHADVENFNPIVSINGDGFNTSTGKPGGLLVMEGVEWHPVDGDGFFAILKDGSAMIGTQAEYETYKQQIQEGIGAFGATLVKDGKIATTSHGTRASRTAIGIKADGSVVMMVLDGRQEPFSCGGSMAEIAQIMYEAGCVNAVNLDGGGSTTYMAKPEGSDTIKIVNRPSDGYARSVAASLVAVSTAKSSKEFDRAIIESDYDYLTVGAELQLTAVGVNNIGSSAEIPSDVYWAVEDESFGSISADGVFTALKNGDAKVNLMLGDAVVGSKELHIVVPDESEFDGGNNLIAIYGVPIDVPFKFYYQGNEVLIADDSYELFLFSYVGGDEEYEELGEEAGSFDGMTFTGNEECNLRTMYIYMWFYPDENLDLMIPVSMYKQDEAYFDFDNATAGNRTLAWQRVVENAETDDGMNYQVSDHNKETSIGYTFALDMTAIEIPDRLADIVFMLPGSDNGNATAFNYLLQLAERVSILTEVRISIQFDKDLDVDISDLKIINDYFVLSDATVDENNKLTLVCNWIDQTQSIDPQTANPVCILTGLKATPADDATWTDNELVVINSGEVSYDIYLRASSLYAFAQNKDNQAKYGLYPYSTDQTGYEGGTESGAHFSSVYADLEDSFIINNAQRQGWYEIDSEYYYFVDHVAQTGVQYVPSRENPSENLFYEFNDNGVCIGKKNGVFEYDGGLYYAINGAKTTGWLSGYDDEGNPVDYYFSPKTGKAVNGVQKIDGFTYTFTDNILTRGDLVKDANGLRYRWAGKWLHGQWFEVDGKWYCTKKYIYYVVTGFANVPSRGVPNWKWHLFDENGVFLSDYTGIYEYEGDAYYIVNGLRDSTVGLVYDGGYYYFISSATAKAHKNTTLWVNKTNNLMPAGMYTFDEKGRMVNPPVVEPENPDIPDVPEIPETPVLNGIVKGDDGKLRYYIDNVLQNGLGLVKLQDENGKDFYIYVLSNGQLAIGSYWVTNTNSLLEAGSYEFDANGRYYVPEETPDEPEVPELKNGVVRDDDGTLRYYINGVRQPGTGVVKLTDENGITYYIYVRSSNAQVVTGVYWPTHRNDLLPSGGYDWGTDGRYYPPTVSPEEPEIPDTPDTPDEPEVPEVKNGIYTENGANYYYVNGVKQKNLGVVKLEDESGNTFYIYVRTGGQLATGVYWPTNRNDLLPRGPYDWGTDGRYYPAG